MPLTRRAALILNFTAYDYHWGCHGTASEIYQTLVERGYQVNWLDVRSTHALTPHPAGIADFTSPEFVTAFFQHHRGLEFAFDQADVVVVNGEGTLHTLRPASLNLLFLMHLARNVFERPVHLINHSFFPAGDDRPDPLADELYGAVARCLTRVVPREPLSRAVLARLGVDAPQGFDCLPRFLRRHAVASASTRSGPLVVSGGVNMDEASVSRLAAALQPHATGPRPLRFLAGAKSAPAAEDRVIFGQLHARLPRLELVDAPDMETWIHTIAGAACLVSGRFHHTIAAATLGTPAVVFPSNTPKVPAMCAMFGIDAPIFYDDPEFVEKTTHAVDTALRGQAPLASSAALDAILACAAENFAAL